MVDMYAKIEQQRLNYIKMNQQQIKSDLYSGLADAVNSGDTNAKEVFVILSSLLLILAVRDKCLNYIRTL